MEKEEKKKKIQNIQKNYEVESSKRTGKDEKDGEKTGKYRIATNHLKLARARVSSILYISIFYLFYLFISILVLFKLLKL